MPWSVGGGSVVTDVIAAVLRTAAATRRRERAVKRLDAAARILGAAAAELAEIVHEAPGCAVDMRRVPWRGGEGEVVTRPGDGETRWVLLRRVAAEGDALVVEVVEKVHGARRTLLVLSVALRVGGPARSAPEPAVGQREFVSELDAVVECAAAERALRVVVERCNQVAVVSGFYSGSPAMREEHEDANTCLTAARERAGRAVARLHEALPRLAVPCVDMRDVAWGIVCDAGEARLVTMVEGRVAGSALVAGDAPYRSPLMLDGGTHCVVETGRVMPQGAYLRTSLLTVALRDDEAARRAPKPPEPTSTPPKTRRPRAPRAPAPIPITRKRGPR